MSKRSSERGAALVTMLLISFLLLAAGGALIVTTSMSATTAISSTAEMQAYYVAEAGLQSALNVLRGNAAPVNGSGLGASTRMSFRAAVTPNVSNGTGNSGALRFAGWLPYNDRLNANSLVPVAVGGVTGGYRVTIQNLDPNSHIVTYSTAGTFNSGSDSYIDCGSGANIVRISYNPQSATTLTPDPNVLPLTLDSNLGSFVITRVSGTAPVNVPPDTTFEMTVTQTAPWAATTTFEATLTGQITDSSTTVEVDFEKISMKADGTTYALNFSGGDPEVLALTYSSSPSTTPVPARVTPPDPKRLLIQSYGFGPNGSEKRVEMIISRANLEFEGIAGTNLRGADDCNDPLVLDTGSSGSKNYSGIDRAGVDPPRPAFAVTACDVNDAISGIKNPDTVSNPKIGVLTNDGSGGTIERPSYLDSADKARSYLNGLETKARSTGRYFPANGSSVTVNDDINSPMFTFVDGDCTLTDGSGFLVVTGTLTMKGNTNFNGVILVLGEGELVRNGGGNGEILGGITIAKFDRTGAGPFYAPTFNTNGGGNSTVQYDSSAVSRGIGSGTSVSGVREF